jgi:hypothetical protein
VPRVKCAMDYRPKNSFSMSPRRVRSFFLVQTLLAQMGVELVSIPAMSDKPERLFSSAKLLICDLRNRLRDDIIEVSECLKSWVKQGLIFGTTESDMVKMEQMLNDLASRSK